MTDTPAQTLTPAKRRRLIAWGLFRALVTATLLVALYLTLPLKLLNSVPVVVSLVVALLILLGVAVWQVRAIIRSAYPGIRAIEALGVTAPLFLLLFAATYFLMAQDDPGSFSTPVLTRSDALYFTVTVFATVGFGDITATTQFTRWLVTIQMLLDLLFVGLGIRVLFSAVERGRQRRGPDPDATTGG